MCRCRGFLHEHHERPGESAGDLCRVVNSIVMSHV